MIGRKNVDMERPSAPGAGAADKSGAPERETTETTGREEAESVESGVGAAPRSNIEGLDKGDSRGNNEPGGI